MNHSPKGNLMNRRYNYRRAAGIVAVIAAFYASLVAAVILVFPVHAEADPYCYENCGGPSDPYNKPSWPGQLMPTWEIPDTYGGHTQDPVWCSPTTLKCWPVARP